MVPLLDLSSDELLSTTRAVRRRLDFERPVEMAVLRECLELALQAPTGSYAQGWHFVLVTDPTLKRGLADLYHRAFAAYRNAPFSAHALAAQRSGQEQRTTERVLDSAEYLAENLHRAPALLIPCIEGRVTHIEGPLAQLAQASVYGSILPAVWSFMLAARARGLGTAWTTLHLFYEKEAADLLGLPHDTVMQTALVPVAYTLGTDFKRAPRSRGLDQVLHLNAW
jgi:nitroreductase